MIQARTLRYNLFVNEIQEKIILDSLNEDLLPQGDITSVCLVLADQNSTFELIVKEDAVLAGLEVFKKAFTLIEKNITIKSGFKDGNEIKKGQLVASIQGNTLSILKAERTALNFVSHLSGVATATSCLVKLLKHTKTVLLDTRKTTPNLRMLEKQAVIAGGGRNHRFNLSERILIKDNHIDVAGGISKAVHQARKTYGQNFKIEVEVRNLEELNEAIMSEPDVIMFDNWDLSDLREALKLVPEKILTEASGGITIENIKAFAESGVNYISTGYMIKNAKWVDFSLNAIK